jgi:LPXTG-site transpeptidase (sortase) family protein
MSATERERVRVRRKRSVWRRITRPVRRLAGVSKLKAGIVVAMVLASAGGAAALVLLLNSGPPVAGHAPSSPPLALGPQGLRRLPVSDSGSAPTTTRLIIPNGTIDLPVVQGDGVNVPLNLAVHYPGTDQPGGGSNALYYAHARPGMFQGLYQLHKDDEIRAVRADGSEVDYHVAALQYVSYNDLSVLNATPYDEITLLTCTSYDPHTPRYIVIGLPGEAR